MVKGAHQGTEIKPEAAVEQTGQEMGKQRDDRASPEIQPMIAKYEFYANEPLRKESKNPKETSPPAKQSEDQENIVLDVRNYDKNDVAVVEAEAEVQQNNFAGAMKPGEPDDSSHLDE